MNYNKIIKGVSCQEDIFFLDKIVPKLDKLVIKLLDKKGDLKIQSIRRGINRIIEGIAIYPYDNNNKVELVSIPKGYNSEINLIEGTVKFNFDGLTYHIYKNQDAFEKLSLKPKP